MFHVCWQCGAYSAEKVIVPDNSATSHERALALCPACGHEHPFLRMPLFLIGGASGTGKSSICHALLARQRNGGEGIPAVVLLDADILWQPAFDTPADGYRAFHETWLRLARNIGQAGRPVGLFGAGLCVPANLEPLPVRRYFSALHYLALVCDDPVLYERLHARPAWRESSDEAFVDAQIEFNRRLRDGAAGRHAAGSPPLTLLDTTDATEAATADAVAVWMRERVG